MTERRLQSSIRDESSTKHQERRTKPIDIIHAVIRTQTPA